jgi:hypothetical protein
MKDFNDKIAKINETLLLPGYTAKTEQSTSAIAVDAGLDYKIGTSFGIGPRFKFIQQREPGRLCRKNRS